MKLSDNIKKYRKAKNMTQKDLARETGLSIASIQGYEQNKYNPKIEQLKKISVVLDVSLYDLTQGTKTAYTLEELKELKAAMYKDVQSIQRLKDDAIIELFHSLTDEGQDKAIEHLKLLTQIPGYRNNNS